MQQALNVQHNDPDLLRQVGQGKVKLIDAAKKVAKPEADFRKKRSSVKLIIELFLGLTLEDRRVLLEELTSLAR